MWTEPYRSVHFLLWRGRQWHEYGAKELDPNDYSVHNCKTYPDEHFICNMSCIIPAEL